MVDEEVVWTSMQGAPGEEVQREKQRKLSAAEIQKQIISDMQDTLVAQHDATIREAEKRGKAMPTPEARTAAMAAASRLPVSKRSGTPYEPGSPDDPDDPENRIMNPGTGLGSYAPVLAENDNTEDGLPPEHAIPRLFERMKGYKPHLLAIMEACTDQAPTEKVDAALAAVCEYNKCPHSAITLRKMLVEAGALECIEPDEAGDEEGTESADSNSLLNEGTDAEVDEGPMSYLVIEENEDEYEWQLTEAGSDYLNGLDLEQDFHDEVAQYPGMEDVFYEILAYCENGRDIIDIVKHFESDSRLGEKTFYASHLVDRLEKVGALVWKKEWLPTEVGVKLLADWRG